VCVVRGAPDKQGTTLTPIFTEMPLKCRLQGPLDSRKIPNSRDHSTRSARTSMRLAIRSAVRNTHPQHATESLVWHTAQQENNLESRDPPINSAPIALPPRSYPANRQTVFLGRLQTDPPLQRRWSFCSCCCYRLQIALPKSNRNSNRWEAKNA